MHEQWVLRQGKRVMVSDKWMIGEWLMLKGEGLTSHVS